MESSVLVVVRFTLATGEMESKTDKVGSFMQTEIFTKVASSMARNTAKELINTRMEIYTLVVGKMTRRLAMEKRHKQMGHSMLETTSMGKGTEKAVLSIQRLMKPNVVDGRMVSALRHLEQKYLNEIKRYLTII